jgi:hypothetical protein
MSALDLIILPSRVSDIATKQLEAPLEGYETDNVSDTMPRRG